MSVVEHQAEDISLAAYNQAWSLLTGGGGLTPEEKADAPEKLRDYIGALVSAGETNPDKIARCAIGLVRQYEQILRSYSAIASPLSRGRMS
jgi:hypothetical protein